MDKNSTNYNRKVYARVSPDQYHSVQFTKKGFCMIYQFKIWNIAKKGMCILVRHDSNIMNHLKVGDLLDMEYYSGKGQEAIDQAKTQIKHITKNEQGQFKGHYLVGLSKTEHNHLPVLSSCIREIGDTGTKATSVRMASNSAF